MEHGDLTFDEIEAVLDWLNGRIGIQAVLAGRDLPTVKYGKTTLGQFEAFRNKLPSQLWDLALAGDIEFYIEKSGEMGIRKVAKPLFDKNGRRIPPKGMRALVRDPNYDFYLVQPEVLDYGVRHLQFHIAGLSCFILPDEFRNRESELLKKLLKNSQTASACCGPHLPIIIPRTRIVNYGKTLEKFLRAVESSYRQRFSERRFRNFLKNCLKKQVSIVPGSRHEQLISRVAEGSVVGIYFPTALQGYSVDAQREQMETLPEGFLLAGGIDTACAWVMYPDILARDSGTPGIECPALKWRQYNYSFMFRGNSESAGFYDVRDEAPCGEFSGGLLYIGTD